MTNKRRQIIRTDAVYVFEFKKTFHESHLSRSTDENDIRTIDLSTLTQCTFLTSPNRFNSEENLTEVLT